MKPNNTLPLKKSVHRLRAVLVALLGAVVTFSGPASALSLTDAPPYLITAVEPNVLLTFDDSGSMSWGYMPDGISGLQNTRRGCARPLNGVAYDPNTVYDPPVNANGAPLFTGASATSFTRAYVNGYNPSGQWLDLSSSSAAGSETSTTNGTGYRYKWDMDAAGNAYQDAAPCATGNSTGQVAYYFLYDPAGTGCGPVGTGNDACYRRVNVSATSGPGGSDERQNFANWYSYYSTRMLMAKTATGRAFARFGTNIRVSGQHLNNTTAGTGTGIRFTTTLDVMRKFCDDPSSTDPDCPNGTARSDFFTRLYNSPANSGTPLIAAMQRAGNHFGSGNTGANSPYRDIPGNSSSPERSCRQNFHILMTDGFWNTSTGTAIGNVDGTAQTLPDGTSYSSTTRPYSDTYSNTLADSSFYYWYRDLRTDLQNNVPTRFTDTTGSTAQNYWNPVNDPANWQHMVTFTIGLGMNGALVNNTATYDALRNGTACTITNGNTLNPCIWLDPNTACPSCDNTAVPGASPDAPSTYGPRRLDDLWHAALNSRGRYFSAGDPASLVASFTAIVNDIVDRISSSSSVAMTSGVVSTNSFIYQSRFNSADWSGQLLAFAIDPATLIPSASPAWDAGVELNQQHYDTGRQIITYKPSQARGIPFRWPSNPSSPGTDELDTTQSGLLRYNPLSGSTDSDAVGQARLNYLRGDASNEGGGLNFRLRHRICGSGPCPNGTHTGVLGDMINSAPIYVGAPRMPYPDTFEAAPYSTFRTARANRTPMVYVGGNDGMLHGFDANTGRERIAYVPGKVYPHLSRLAHDPYAHKYFVDGDMTVADVFVGGQWRTILVGSLRHGGQGIYALDVSDPASFTETNAQSLVLWEFTDAHDVDLGYTYSRPAVAKMHNGKWAVIFGNGYNNSIGSTILPDIDSDVSTTGRAALYVLFIEEGMDGTWSSGDFVKITVPSGTVGQPNGLATPAVADMNGDGIADFVYAGDLNGNMWRFDLRNPTASTWTASANTKLVYTARDATGNLQPITSKPTLAFHPYSLPGLMVYFGTGKYLENTDASVVGATPQTFYGVWDQEGSLAPVTAPTRSHLLQQSVITTVTQTAGEFRTTTNAPMVWRDGVPPPTPSYIGWYMDLPTTGERVFTDGLLFDNWLMFATVIPSEDPCSTGGDSWLMCLNPVNGGRPERCFASANPVVIGGAPGQSVSGQKVTGIAASPVVLTGTEGVKAATSTSNATTEMTDLMNNAGKRKGWWQRK